MSDQASTVETTVDETVAAAVLAAQMTIIDAAVRQSRSQGWCERFEEIMGQLFPDGPPDGSKEFVDSDGWSCRNIDRDGFNRDGYDREGFNRDGFNGSGWGRDGFHRETGRDRAGFDREGVREDGLRKDSDEYRARFKFNRSGYDREGYDRDSRNRDGLTREQVAEYGDQLYIYEWDQDHGLLTVDGMTTDGYTARGHGRYEPPADYALLRQLSRNY